MVLMRYDGFRLLLEMTEFANRLQVTVAHFLCMVVLHALHLDQVGGLRGLGCHQRGEVVLQLSVVMLVRLLLMVMAGLRRHGHQVAVGRGEVVDHKVVKLVVVVVVRHRVAGRVFAVVGGFVDHVGGRLLVVVDHVAAAAAGGRGVGEGRC